MDDDIVPLSPLVPQVITHPAEGDALSTIDDARYETPAARQIRRPGSCDALHVGVAKRAPIDRSGAWLLKVLLEAGVLLGYVRRLRPRHRSTLLVASPT